MQNSHIVFDFDGTLVSTMDDVMWGMKQILEQHLKREIPDFEMREKFDIHPEYTIQNFGIDVESNKAWMMDAWTLLMEDRHQHYHLFPGIRELLTDLKKLDFKLYVWTARDRISTEKIMKTHELWPFFEDIRTSSCTIPKPHTQGLSEMLGHIPLEKRPQQVMVIGDGHTDMQGARDFGCVGLGAAWCAMAKPDQLAHFGARHVVKEAGQILPLIRQHFMI